MKNLFSYVYSVVFPRYCYCCKNVLVQSERYFCLNCLIELNKTYDNLDLNSSLSDKVSIYMPARNVSAYLYFGKNQNTQKLIHQFKYQEDIIVGKELSEMFCSDLEKCEWMKNIDLIVPMPLHWIRKIERGYNQSLIISNIIGKHFNIPVGNNYLIRTRYTKSQTRKSKEKRWENVNNIFSVKNTKELENKHILLVDDIITTGASINSCIKELKTIQGIQFYVVCLAVTEN